MPGSLSKFANFKSDARSLLTPATAFHQAEVKLGGYVFVPWVRSGLAGGIDDSQFPIADNRPQVSVSLKVKADGSDAQGEVGPFALALYGPGDVIGIQEIQRKIIRRFPRPGTPDAEETCVAHIEFDLPEFPWLLTPDKVSGGRLRPWLALVVCDTRQVDILPGENGFPPQLHAPVSELQPLESSWAWAHAQVLPGSASVADRLSPAYAPQNLSRLLCPRKLEPQTSYVACLVPAFECGVRAASGRRGGGLGPAWSTTATGARVLLPILDHWRFRTGEAGDFESLAGKLHPVKAPWNVGRRVVDTRFPQGGMTDVPDGEGSVQMLECAVHSPAQPEMQVDGWPVTRRNELRMKTLPAAAATDDLPRIGPRIYAQFQRGSPGLPELTSAPAGDWFVDLNTDPLHRIVAGLGTRVVVRDQEALMQSAWAQLGEIEKANRALERIRFGRYIAERIHQRVLSRLPLGTLTQVLRPAHAKLRHGDITVHARIAHSRVAPMATTAAFRKAFRINPVSAKRFGSQVAQPGNMQSFSSAVAFADEFRDFRRPFVEPAGIASLDERALQAIGPERLGEALGVAPAVAEVEARARFSGMTTAVDSLLQSPPVPLDDDGIDLAKRAARRLLERVEAAAAVQIDSDEQAAKADLTARVLAAVARSGAAEGLRDRIDRQLLALDALLPDAVRGRGCNPLPGMLAKWLPPLRRRMALQRFTSPLSQRVTAAFAAHGQTPYREVVTAWQAVAMGTGIERPVLPVLHKLELERGQLLDLVRPAERAKQYALARFAGSPPWVAAWIERTDVAPIMAAPRFERAMYEALADYDRTWLVSGMDAFDRNNFVTLLVSNPAFIEAFLIGLSDEMGRELLWRGYPTDQRATYFRSFWKEARPDLTADIHRFAATALGSHQVTGNEARIVMMVRGDVVRRYPDAMFLAMQGDANGLTAQSRAPAAGATGSVLFRAALEPDILLVGFDMDLQEAKRTDRPWWFVLAEHPTEPKFGLDLPSDGARGAKNLSLNNIQWSHLQQGKFLSMAKTYSIGTLSWPPVDPAVAASILLQMPVRAAFKARAMLG